MGPQYAKKNVDGGVTAFTGYLPQRELFRCVVAAFNDRSHIVEQAFQCLARILTTLFPGVIGLSAQANGALTRPVRLVAGSHKR
jgi:hypothetical protein